MDFDPIGGFIVLKKTLLIRKQNAWVNDWTVQCFF